MGFLILQESVTFIPRNYGIRENTAVNVIAVGGGAGGQSGQSYTNSGSYISPNNVTGGKGGSSGKGGGAGAGYTDNGGDESYSYSGGSGGGGGGGFGAGGGGGGEAAHTSSLSKHFGGGGGGGAGQIVCGSVCLPDPDEKIAVTIGQIVSADTNGQATSFGPYITAAGGKTPSAYGEIGATGGYTGNGGTGSFMAKGKREGGSGGGGGGGYQIGIFNIGGDGESKPIKTDGTTAYESGGDGGGYGAGEGGAERGYPGADGWTYLHSGLNNSGVILLFW